MPTAFVKFMIFMILPLFLNICDCGEHLITGIFSDGNENFGMTFNDYTLFTRNNSIPKSYIVKYKYVGDPFSRTLYWGLISSNAENTWGSGDLANGLDIKDNHYLNAEIDIKNATNFWVKISMHGMPGIGNVGLHGWLRIKLFRPRSSALICTVDKEQSKSKYRQIVFGTRRPGDFILRASKENVISNNAELPRYSVEFEDDGFVLTSVIIKLNTTQAIIFNNKVVMTEHRFSSTVYGLNRNLFTAIYIIYGYKI